MTGTTLTTSSVIANGDNIYKSPVHGENYIRRVDELVDNGQLDFGVLNGG